MRLFELKSNIDDLEGLTIKCLEPISPFSEYRTILLKINEQREKSKSRGGHRKSHIFFDVTILDGEMKDGSEFQKKGILVPIDALTFSAEEIVESGLIERLFR